MCDFSLIIPVYNIKPEYLKKCFSSVLNQNIKSWEMFVIDDGSTNPETLKGLEELKSATSSDERIKIISQENRGVSSARNQGLKHANGEYILFLDADDCFREDCFEKLLLALNSEKPDILFFKHFSCRNFRYNDNLFDDTNRIIRLESFPDVVSEIINVKGKYGNYNLGTPWGKAIKAEIIKANSIRYQENLPRTQDRVFMLDCISAASSLFLYDYTAYIYNDNPFSVCSKYNPNLDIKLLNVYDAFESRRGKFKFEIENQIQAAKWSFFFEVLNLDIFHKDNIQTFIIRRKNFMKVLKEYDLSFKEDVLALLPKNREIMAKLIKFHLFDFVIIMFMAKMRNKQR